MLRKLITRNRSYRRFYQDHALTQDVLRSLVELARLSPSRGNLQPLRFYLSCEKGQNAQIFETLSWAGYLEDWYGPLQGERPAGYIVILADATSPKPAEYDAGIAAQSILLGAVEKGLGGCIIGSVKRTDLMKALTISDKYRIMLVIALGKPKEKVVVDPIIDEDVKYWRDDNEVHHVPKRNLDDIIISRT